MDQVRNPPELVRCRCNRCGWSERPEDSGDDLRNAQDPDIGDRTATDRQTEKEASSEKTTKSQEVPQPQRKVLVGGGSSRCMVICSSLQWANAAA